MNHKKPTETGYYWYLMPYGEIPQIVQISTNGLGQLTVEFIATTIMMLLDDFCAKETGHWTGSLIPDCAGLLETAKYWADVSECTCESKHPIGACLKCDMDNAVTILQQISTQHVD